MCHPQVAEMPPEWYCIKPLVNVMWVSPLNMYAYMWSLAYKLDAKILVVRNHF